MGHRKSHHRASKKTPEVLLSYPKDQHDTHDCGSKAGGRSRREKQNHKRKREHEDVSKRKRKERHRGSYSSSKSSSKGKSRDKVRKKYGKSNKSDSSSSSLGSKGGQHGSNSHSDDADVLRKRARSPIADVRQEDYKESNLKKMKMDKEAFGSSPDYRDAPMEHLRSEKYVHKCIDSELGNVGKYVRLSSSSQYTRSDRGRSEKTIMTSKEHKIGLEEKKENVLEDKLRQKALANFLRHQDASWGIDEHDPILDSDIRWPAASNDRDERVVSEVDSRCLLAVGNIHAEQWPNAREMVAPADVKYLAKESDNNLEEGEIESDMCIDERVNENGSSTVHKVLHEEESIIEGKPHTTRDDHEEFDSRISSGGETHRVSMATPCVEKKEERSQEQTVKDCPDIDLVSARCESSGNNFQEKTMSVMRGGEVVQVSYKVYIPKRAAELARRRLQR